MQKFLAGIISVYYKDCFCRGFSKTTFLACLWGRAALLIVKFVGEVFVKFDPSKSWGFLGFRF